MIYYNREYSKIIDFVSDIGGISNVIISIFYFINKLFYNINNEELINMQC